MLILLFVVGATPAYAHADGDVYKLKEIYKGTVTIALMPKSEGQSVHLPYVIPGNGKVTKVKSSNKSVVDTSMAKDGANGKTYLVVEGKKAGKAKLSYTYKGTRHTVTFVFKKWVKPVKSLTIGGKQCASKFKRSSGFLYSQVYGTTGNEMAGKKLKVTAATGWKVKSVKYFVGPQKLKSMRNGAKVPKNYGTVRVKLQNIKTGATETIWME